MALFSCNVGLSYAANPLKCISNNTGEIENRFTDNKDGTATDNYTGLIWRRCNLTQEWNEATSSCENFVAKYNWKETLQQIDLFNQDQISKQLDGDWRLPNIKEQASVLNLQCIYPALDTTIFPDPVPVVWTSTPISFRVTSEEIYDVNDPTLITGYTDKNLIWIVNTSTAKDSWDTWERESYGAMLVRGTSTR